MSAAWPPEAALMRGMVNYRTNTAGAAAIADFLRLCDARFNPPLGARVDIPEYAQKIASAATCFEAWSDGMLIGLVAVYCNDLQTRTAHITSVSVLQEWTGQGIAARLMDQCVVHAKSAGLQQMGLEVAADNRSAIALYEKFGFTPGEPGRPVISMQLEFRIGETMNKTRDYNVEIADTSDHKYAYGFDFDVMHPYMIRSFEPFLRPGNVLELGSFKGDFTRRLQPYFQDITCVEASDVAVAEAARRMGDKVTYINAMFETATLPARYDNIVLTHVLEHLDDPVAVLKRVNKEWLSERGRFFLVCPNANAPSRQIAVKMGLISHNAAVTQAEALHGHRCTYSLDTLERDAVAAGLKVVHRSGIFFKALANFQWDRLLQTDIVSQAYLDGCYQLGQQYPDLCASIFLVCERGDA